MTEKTTFSAGRLAACSIFLPYWDGVDTAVEGGKLDTPGRVLNDITLTDPVPTMIQKTYKAQKVDDLGSSSAPKHSGHAKNKVPLLCADCKKSIKLLSCL